MNYMMSFNDNSILDTSDTQLSAQEMAASPGYSSASPPMNNSLISSPGNRSHNGPLFGAPDNEPPTAENDFLKRIFDNTVHGTCQVPGMCNAASLEDQLDVFMNCRQPLSVFSFFQENNTRETVRAQVLPGAYALPTYCEYCKAHDPSSCPSHCERPKLYFQKKRPPFRKLDPNRWNPQNDFALKPHEIWANEQDDKQSEEDEQEAFDFRSWPESPVTCKQEVASLVSTSGSSSSGGSHHSAEEDSPSHLFPSFNEPTTNEPYQHMPRHATLLGMFPSRRAQHVIS